MISKNLADTMQRAQTLAADRNHDFLTLEHIVLAMIDDPDGKELMQACGVDLEQLGETLTLFIDEEMSELVNPNGEAPRATPKVSRVYQRAAIHVQSSGREEITAMNVLVAAFSERESHAVYFLQELGMTRLDATQYISHGISKVPGLNDPSRKVRGADEMDEAGEGAEGSGKPSALDEYCVASSRVMPSSCKK